MGISPKPPSQGLVGDGGWHGVAAAELVEMDLVAGAAQNRHERPAAGVDR
jgi:hypothetical protein